MVVPDGPQRKKKPRAQSVVASSLAKFFFAKSNPVKSAPVEPAPAESAPVEPVPVKSAPTESAPVVSVPAESDPAESVPVKSPPRSYWEVSRRSGFGRILDDGCGGTFFFDFGHFSRSIQFDSTSFE